MIHENKQLKLLTVQLTKNILKRVHEFSDETILTMNSQSVVLNIDMQVAKYAINAAQNKIVNLPKTL